LLEISDPRSELAIIVAAIFEETSKLVLETLVNKFKLFQHFQGLRRYILLGQGDFANYFMELIE
jgi:gamma-tubulin complex component 3